MFNQICIIIVHLIDYKFSKFYFAMLFHMLVL